jgi:carbamate kinase
VIDKDLSAALLARQLGADALLLLTDVDGVEVDGETLTDSAPDELRGLNLPAGSMGPKAEAAARFAEHTGRPAVIASLDDAAAALAGDAGTRVSLSPVATGGK